MYKSRETIEYDNLIAKGLSQGLSNAENERLLELSKIRNAMPDISELEEEDDIEDEDEDKLKRYELYQTILKDDNIVTAVKNKFLRQSKLFISDFEDNLSKTSIRLGKNYPQFTVDEWNDYLRYPSVNRYLRKYRSEVLSEQVGRAFSEGKATVAAINLKNDLDQESKMTNNNIIILRMPEKDTDTEFNYV